MQYTENNLECLKSIRDYIYKESGIFFSDNKLYQLEDKINERIKLLNKPENFEQYFRYIKYDSGKEKELNSLFDIITTGETDFFRHTPQLDAFQNEILPLIIEKNKKKSIYDLNIWSAGCSTGEEPYTLIILMLEKLGAQINKFNIKCIANDISASALHTARQGIYDASSLKNTPPECIRRYFDKQDNNFVVKDEVKKFVQFNIINLTNQFRLKLLPKMDVVFCRNVLIYFNEDSKKKVISSFYDIMKEDSYLFLGHSETLYGITQNFKSLFFANTIVYSPQKDIKSA